MRKSDFIFFTKTQYFEALVMPALSDDKLAFHQNQFTKRRELDDRR
jgi:hypothetical protein